MNDVPASGRFDPISVLMGPDGELLGVWHDINMNIVVGKMIDGKFVDRLDLERGEIFALAKCMSDLFQNILELENQEEVDMKQTKFLLIGGLN